MLNGYVVFTHTIVFFVGSASTLRTRLIPTSSNSWKAQVCDGTGKVLDVDGNDIVVTFVDLPLWIYLTTILLVSMCIFEASDPLHKYASHLLFTSQACLIRITTSPR
jgi:hypothetical protein